MDNSTNQEDENCLRIEDLPVEIMVEIFSYLDTNEKVKVSMVNKRWFGILDKEIEAEKRAFLIDKLTYMGKNNNTCRCPSCTAEADCRIL